MYKESKAFKGFEVLYHQLQMNFKMYLYTFLIVLLIHMIIPLLYILFFQTKIVELAVTAISNFYVQFWPKLFLLIFQKGFVVFILATPIWLLFPVFLKKFKAKSQEIIQDRHIRGSKLISDDELRKIVLNDIKQGRRF